MHSKTDRFINDGDIARKSTREIAVTSGRNIRKMEKRTILYVRPSDPTRTAIVDYADAFARALDILPDGRTMRPLPDDLSERIDTRTDRDAVLAYCARWVREHAEELRGPVLVHVEQGNALHREFWAGVALRRALPHARFFTTIHDPPFLSSNPYRFVRTEFEGRTPVRLLNVALTKMAEEFVAFASRRIERVFLRRCEAVIALTQGGLDRLRGSSRFHGVRLEHIPHVYLGGSIPSDSGNSPDGPVVGMFSLLAPGKGIEDLLDAYERLRERLERESSGMRPRLIVFGGIPKSFALSPYYSELRERFERSKWSGEMRFAPGFVTDAERDRLLASTDILVLPFRSTPNVAFSSASLRFAMGAGRTVVVSDAGTLSESIREGVTGFVYPEGNIEALTERLYALCLGPDTRRKVGREAARFMEDEHSPHAVAKRLTEIYR
jgi:glycosyltransferase involved in cell wall biosynthesis